MDVAFDEKRRVTALHEAGHAVTGAMRGGGEVRSITIIRPQNFWDITAFASSPMTARSLPTPDHGLRRAQWQDEVELDGETAAHCHDAHWRYFASLISGFGWALAGTYRSPTRCSASRLRVHRTPNNWIPT